LAWAAVAAWIFARPGNLPQSVLQRDLCLLRQELSACIHKIRLRWNYKSVVLPRTVDLRELFLQGHSRKQIVYSLFNRKLWIPIRRQILCTSCNRHKEEKRHNSHMDRRPITHSLFHATSSPGLKPLHCVRRVVLYTAVNVNGTSFCSSSDTFSLLLRFTLQCLDPGDIYERRPVPTQTGA